MLHILFFVPFLLFAAQCALAAITISLEGPPIAQASVNVRWSRAPEDPQIQSLSKLKLDELDRVPLRSGEIPIPNPADTTGVVDVDFNRAGVFQILASDSQKRLLFTSPSFGVAPPAIVGNGLISNQTVASDSISGSTSSTSKSPSNTTKSTPPSPKPSPSPAPNTAVVVSATLGTVFFLFIVGLLVVFIRRRARPKVTFNEATSSIPSVPFQYNMNSPPDYSVPIVQSPPATFRRGHPYGHVDLEKAEWSPRPYPFTGVDSRSPKSPSRDYLDMSPGPSPHSPMSSLHNIAKKSSRTFRRLTAGTTFTSGTTGTVSTMQFNPLTGRQIELEERIYEMECRVAMLQHDIRTASGPSLQEETMLWKLRGQVEDLIKLKQSPWALGLTDEEPPGLRTT